MASKGVLSMTLRELAEELALRLNCKVQPGENPFEVLVQGKGYHFVVAPFFGGWQATLHLPEKPPHMFYAEAVEMLEARLRAKLTGQEANF